MHYLLLSSLLLIGCSSAYRNLQKTSGDIHAIEKFRPVFKVALYKTEVNVMGNYLSGLLLLKKMPDSSTRIVFSNELGLTFFDFEFSKKGDFKVYQVIKQMDRKAVIKTLRKDFELILMDPLDFSHAYLRTADQLKYYVFPQVKGLNYYITDITNTELVRMERASKRKTVVTILTKNYNSGLPDSIGITHNNFHFIIGLKKIER